MAEAAIALEFLEKFQPGGPWVLTAISTDKKAIETRTFDASTVDAAAAWLSGHLGVRNLYFAVNPTVKPVNKMPELAEMASLAWLHVDIDPREGEDLETEKKRGLELLRRFVPAPTVIIDSGGGVQGFWKLNDPFTINGDVARAEKAKLYNLQLERDFGADHCHNVNRIMRLPGTINLPDAKKAKKGRVACPTKLISFYPGHSYDIAKFTAAPEVQEKHEGALSSGPVKVTVSGNVPRLNSVHDLPDSVPDWTKVVIVQGNDPDDPNRWPSRSEALFAVLCALVRAGVEDDVIYSVITDKEFGIAASVLEKRNPEKYALRQLSRAKEESIHPMLRELNEKHAVIRNMSGKPRVVTEVVDEALDRSLVVFSSFDDFQNMYLNVGVVFERDDGKKSSCPAGKWWLSHKMRRTYETLTFAPLSERPDTYNLWRGYGVAPRAGDCSLFLTHLKDNICSGNEEHFEYLMNWMARGVQKPGSQGEVAVVLRGSEGTGKGLFAKTYGSLFGRHFLHVSDPKRIVGSFNAHLRDCVLLFADEAFYAGDKKHESILKTLITEETLMIEAKGIDVVSARNFIHMIMASNADWVVPVGQDARRFFVLDVSKNQMQNTDYFGAIVAQLKDGGREALLHLLLQRDISKFEVRTAPRTKALAIQREFTFDPVEEWWKDKLEQGEILTGVGWPEKVEKDELFNNFYTYMQRLSITRRTNHTSLTRALKKFCGDLRPTRATIKRDVMYPDGSSSQKMVTVYLWQLPSLAECRRRWDELMGQKTDWQEIPEGQAAGREQDEIPF
jgi:hypothetical protein